MATRHLVHLDSALVLAEAIIAEQPANPGVPAGVHDRRQSRRLDLLQNLRGNVHTLETSPHRTEKDEGDGENGATYFQVFCTSDCSAVWLLPAYEVPPDPPHASPRRRAYGIELRSQDKHELAEPVGADTTPGVRFVANAICKGLDVAIARGGAQIINDYLYEPGGPKEVKSALTRLADGLDAIPRNLSAGISWIMTDVFGMPDFFGQVVGTVLASVLLAPFHLHQVATVVRVADVVISEPAPTGSSNGILKDVTELMLNQRVAEVERGSATAPPPRPLCDGIRVDVKPPDPTCVSLF